jgi:uncharacterized protein YuzE
MRYDQEDDALMIWFSEGGIIDHAEQAGQTILHVSDENKPILLEVLNARELVIDLVRTVLMAPTTTSDDAA